MGIGLGMYGGGLLARSPFLRRLLKAITDLPILLTDLKAAGMLNGYTTQTNIDEYVNDGIARGYKYIYFIPADPSWTSDRVMAIFSNSPSVTWVAGYIHTGDGSSWYYKSTYTNAGINVDGARLATYTLVTWGVLYKKRIA